MRETDGSLCISLLNKFSRLEILRCSGCILFTMLQCLLTSVTKSERLLALEIFLSYMCIWRKLLQLNFFFLLTNAILAFFCTYEGFYNCVSCTIFHPFFFFLDTIS